MESAAQSTTATIKGEEDDATTLAPSSTIEKPSSRGCSIHGPQQTPLLTAHAADPHTQASLLALSAALAQAAEEGACLRCAVESITQTLARYIQEMREARKSGRWTHEEGRALKAEAKSLVKGMKQDLKQSWRGVRGHGGGAPRPVRHGFYWKR